MQRASARTPTSSPESYRVRAGDNLYRIALEHGLDYRELARWNGITHPERVVAGTILRLRPPPDGRPMEEIDEAKETPIKWAWPAIGEVIAGFNEAIGRKGIQIAAPHGSPVFATAPGRVVYTGEALRGYGRLTIIRHGKEWLSVYAHQSKILVKEGDRVAQGQKIGEVGDTDAERPKLHFEIRAYGRPVNPADYLPGRTPVDQAVLHPPRPPARR